MITQEAHILPFLPSKRVQLQLSIDDSLFQNQRAVAGMFSKSSSHNDPYMNIQVDG